MIKKVCDRCGRQMSMSEISEIQLQLGDYKYSVTVAVGGWPRKTTIDLCEPCMYKIIKSGELAHEPKDVYVTT